MSIPSHLTSTPLKEDSPISPIPSPIDLKSTLSNEVIAIDDKSEADEALEERETAETGKWVAEAKARHEEDLRHHHYEAPKADKVQNDWQVAYVWAFISTFNLRDKIRKLECLEDFERCLTEPLANRPDDILEGILIRFLTNLKPGLRNIDCTNIQHHVSNYISDMLLNTTEFTVWDRPWAPHEEPRGSCCNSSSQRQELGRLRYPGEPLTQRMERNPIRQAEAKGGGLFELDWRERASLLRQMVDWQLNHAEGIRAIINRPHIASQKNKAAVAHVPEMNTTTEPIGMDRNKSRIWTFDASPRLYSSGNPFKRPCPLITISTTRTELQELIDKYTAHGASVPPRPKSSSSKGKPLASEMMAYKKLMKGIDDERKLAERLTNELLPEVEKEEQRIARAKRKIQQALEIASMAESRSTRTRRPTRKVDYTYADDDDDIAGSRSRHDVDYNESGPSTSSRSSRPVTIPGERASARVRGRPSDPTTYLSNDQGNNEDSSSGQITPLTADSGDPGPSHLIVVDVDPPTKKKKRAKGYAWVEEIVPFDQLTAEEKARLLTSANVEQGDGAANPEHQEDTVGKENGHAEQKDNDQVEARGNGQDDGRRSAHAEGDENAVGNVEIGNGFVNGNIGHEEEGKDSQSIRTPSPSRGAPSADGESMDIDESVED